MSSKRKTKAPEHLADTETVTKKQKKEEVEQVDLSKYADLQLEGSKFEGHILFSGATNWDLIGRKEVPKSVKQDVGGPTLWGPHRWEGLEDVKIRSVISSCTASHCVAISIEGKVYVWGRNDKGQLGVGDCERRDTPTTPTELEDYNIVTAATGRNHTLFVTDKGDCFAAGDNKMGQLGVGGEGNNFTSPVKIDYRGPPICKVACGGEFSVFVNVEGQMYTSGCPEYGQTGHNTDGKYFISSNKMGFNLVTVPTIVPLFIDRDRDGSVIPIHDVLIEDVVCGPNHTVALDRQKRVFSWGFGGYGRLGHSTPKDEFVPRIVNLFNGGQNRGATMIGAGGSYSMAVNVLGQLYLWGQTKSTGEAAMYPKPVSDLSGWHVRSIGCSNRSIAVAADASVVTWGCSPTFGELAMGPSAGKSSTKPQEPKPLKDTYVHAISCGMAFTLFLMRTENEAEMKIYESFPLYSPTASK